MAAMSPVMIPTGKYTVGNQAALIRSAFQGRSLEGLMLAGGVHPGVAAGVAGLGVDLSPLYPSLPSPSSIGTPTFSTTVTSTAPSLLSQIIGSASDFITSRWGQQRGTITYNPDGSITQKQTQGVPIQTQAPYIIGGTIPGQQTAAGLIGSGISTGTVLLVGGGLLVLMMAMRGGKK